MKNLHSSNIEATSFKAKSDYYTHLTKKISSINKKLINETLKKDSIKKLEKEVIRNQEPEKPERKKPSLVFPRLDMIELILDPDHKEKNNSNPVRIGKTPYGKHHSYNEEDRSVIQKIFTTSNDGFDSQGETLGEIKKKFRLNDKRLKTGKKVNLVERRVSCLDFFDTFDMQHGNLYCEKNDYAVQGYVRDVEKFRKIWFHSFDSGDRKKKVDKKLQDFSISRLYSGSGVRSKRDTYFTQKYNILFGGEKMDCKENHGLQDRS